MAKSLQQFISDAKKDALFTYQRMQVQKDGRIALTNRYYTVRWGYVSHNLKKVCDKYNIRDETGKIYNLTAHQFRHNGITDRLEAGFTTAQIAGMIGHHEDAMIFGA